MKHAWIVVIAACGLLALSPLFIRAATAPATVAASTAPPATDLAVQVSGAIRNLEMDDALARSRAEQNLKKYQTFAVSVYQPFCGKHGGVMSVKFTKDGVAYPAVVTCRDNYFKTLEAPKSW